MGAVVAAGGGEECRGLVGRSEGTHDQLDGLQNLLGDAYSNCKQVLGIRYTGPNPRSAPLPSSRVTYRRVFLPSVSLLHLGDPTNPGLRAIVTHA